VQSTLDERIANGYVFEESSDSKTIQYRKYLTESKGKLVNSLWNDFNNIVSTADKYDTQKPKALIERIMKASSNEGDLVADFYGGSFTTAEVCKDLNRNFIGCDISKKGVNIGLERCGLINDL